VVITINTIILRRGTDRKRPVSRCQKTFPEKLSRSLEEVVQHHCRLSAAAGRQQRPIPVSLVLERACHAGTCTKNGRAGGDGPGSRFFMQKVACHAGKCIKNGPGGGDGPGSRFFRQKVACHAGKCIKNGRGGGDGPSSRFSGSRWRVTPENA
jgi:hypothetical protein